MWHVSNLSVLITNKHDHSLIITKKKYAMSAPVAELLTVDIEESHTLKNKIFNAVPADHFELLLCDTEQR